MTAVGPEGPKELAPPVGRDAKAKVRSTTEQDPFDDDCPEGPPPVIVVISPGGRRASKIAQDPNNNEFMSMDVVDVIAGVEAFQKKQMADVFDDMNF